MKATPRNLKYVSWIAKKLGLLNLWIPCEKCTSLNIQANVVSKDYSTGTQYMQFICNDCGFSEMYYMIGRFTPDVQVIEPIKKKKNGKTTTDN